ncbi:ferredoxin [Escherichia coli]|uniref:Ferredoxin n=1 Tax=Escherichia coli TaxID=562 RepID=A0A376WZF6_ECOLX|nr:ferredoxin [Escherichia coli]
MALFWKLIAVKPFSTQLWRNGIEIEHACEKSCACTTCHCIVREGFDSLPESSEQEDDMLDKAWGLEPEKPFKLPGARYRRRFSSRNPALHYQPWRVSINRG